jgi:hypothetical protein
LADNRQHGVQHVEDCLSVRPAPLERLDVVGVLHEQQKLSLGLGVEEQRPGADVGLIGDLLGGDVIDAVLGEQLAGGGDDAVELLLLVPLAPPGRGSGDGHGECPPE